MIQTRSHSLLLPAFLALSAMVGLSACTSKASTDDIQSPSATTIAVRTLTLAERNFERQLVVQGSLESRYYANVAARSAGNLDSIFVDKGDAVIAGETVLFQVDPTSYRNALTIAEQDLAVAKSSSAVARASQTKVEAEARKARLDFERYERLHAADKVSDSDFERVEMGYAQAKAGVMIAKAQAELAEQQVRKAEAAMAISAKDLKDTRVVAPISGVVTQRTAEPGEFMSVGRVLLRIDDVEQIDAAAFLPAQYYSEIVPGNTKFKLQINKKEAGSHTIRSRSPTIDTTLRTFEIKGQVSPVTTAVVPGNMAELSIVLDAFPALGVPEASIITRSGVEAVFVVENSIAYQRPIETGLSSNGWVEVKSGIKAGDVVIIEGQTLLRDGMRVSVR